MIQDLRQVNLSMLEIYLAGTGGMKPLPDRALTGMWAEHKGKALLIDCGEGMQISLARIGRSLAKLDILLLTHFHADHISGLPGLLLSAGNFGKTNPLKIYAPKGAADIIEKLCCICPELPFELDISELDENGSQIIWDDIVIDAMPVRHRIDCFCYRITENRLPEFDPQKAAELNIPQRLWKRLHSGESITEGDRSYTPDMVISGLRKPLIVTYITDTLFFEGLIEFARNSDLLICEGMYGDDEYIPKMQEKCHMVFSQSAEIARKSNSKELWLTHYSPALTCPEEYKDMMNELFPAAIISTDGMHKTIK